MDSKKYLPSRKLFPGQPGGQCFTAAAWRGSGVMKTQLNAGNYSTGRTSQQEPMYTAVAVDMAIFDLFTIAERVSRKTKRKGNTNGFLKVARLLEPSMALMDLLAGMFGSCDLNVFDSRTRAMSDST